MSAGNGLAVTPLSHGVRELRTLILLQKDCHMFPNQTCQAGLAVFLNLLVSGQVQEAASDFIELGRYFRLLVGYLHLFLKLQHQGGNRGSHCHEYYG